MRLYKYCRYSHNLIASLSREKVWLSSADKLNDIFDCKYGIGERLTRDKMEELRALNELRKIKGGGDIAVIPPVDADEEVFQKAHDANSEVISKVIRSFGVTSFSEIPDSLLMWAHYSGDHAGACLEFDVDLAREDLYRPYPVIYTTQYPVADIYDFCVDPAHAAFRILRSKSIEWAYEKEWRLLVVDSANQEIDCPYLLKSITFGARMREIDQETIRRVMGTTSVAYKKARESSRAFKILIEEA